MFLNRQFRTLLPVMSQRELVTPLRLLTAPLATGRFCPLEPLLSPPKLMEGPIKHQFQQEAKTVL